MKSDFFDKKIGFIKIDPRTKIFLLILGNIAFFVASTLKIKMFLMIYFMIFGFLCGVIKASFGITIAYYLFLLTAYLTGKYFVNSFGLMLMTFSQFVSMVLPCGLLATIMIKTTKVNEFMAALTKLKISKNVIIPLTVMLRYFPSVHEDWKKIKDAMKMRDVSPTFVGFLKKPSETVNCLYVPMLMAASKTSDELTAAAITRAVENPKTRTCLLDMKINNVDYICTGIVLAIIIIEFFI